MAAAKFTPEQELLLTAFVDNVRKKHRNVDPEKELKWFSLVMGFFLGRGLGAATSRRLAIELNRRQLL